MRPPIVEQPHVLTHESQYKSSMFKVQRNDAKILVIPHKHVDELRNMPESKVSAIHAHLKNLLARYIGVNLLLESDLHTRVLQTKLTPILATTIPTMIDEMDFAMESEIPDCNDKWVPVHIQEILLRIVARTSARIFVGADLCRNEEWLSTSINYTENIFETVITLRGIPSFLHPIVSVMLPSYWRVRSNLATAKRFICPMVTERREKEASGDVDYQKPKDLLQMMMDAANEAEGQPGKLAHRQLLLSLASIHTTTMQAAHALYDLCAHPEHFQTLRQEISAVMAEDGGFHKTTLNKLRKMDSLLKESQRMNPPSLCKSAHLNEPANIPGDTRAHTLTSWYSGLQPTRHLTSHPLRRDIPPSQHPLRHGLGRHPPRPELPARRWRPGHLRPVPLL